MGTKENLQEQLISKAAEDNDFRSRLIADPNGTIESELDIELPDDLELRVHEDGVKVANLVLPPTARLSDQQMELAAGGGNQVFCSGWL